MSGDKIQDGDPIQVTEAVDDDLESIVGLLADDPLGATRENASLPLDQRYQLAFDRIREDPGNSLLVARQGAILVGVIQLTVIPNLTYLGRPRAQVEGVRVRSSHRGKGIGRQLLQESIRRARLEGCHLIQLTTDKRRPEAVEFYESFGFVASHEGMKLSLS